MNNEQYWLWLTNIKGIGRVKIKNLLHDFEHPNNIWDATENELKTVKKLQIKDMKTILESKDSSKIIKLSEKIKGSNVQYYSIEHNKYPKSLKNIYDAPFGIYVRGELLDDETPKVAIVGARNCSEYGKWVAEYFSRELTKMGILIVSGMARGIDTAAHKGALKGSGNTYAILGSGVNICYPKENLNLMKEIENNGAVISELPINATPIPGNFPLRNRIISGLSDGVLIVEAASKSGSLITADLALDQGKDVYAIPGRITDKLSEGTNDLIKIGAKFVTKIDDILEEFFTQFNNKKQKNSENMTLGLAENEKMVYSCLSLEPLFIDEIINLTNIPIDEIQHMLTILEFKGVIKQLPNKYFIKT